MGEFLLPASLSAARVLQEQLRKQVRLTGSPTPRFLAALDASHPTRFSKHQGQSVAAAVLWDCQQAMVVEVATAAVDPATLFPYVAGFLSLREAPVYLAALARLSRQPDLLLVDGQGVAHPRRFGIACHLGVHLDLPAIGVAKSLLCGTPEAELAEAAGSAVRLLDRGEAIGFVYRSRIKVKPLYVSPGHLLGMGESLEWVRSLTGKTRLLEPLRQAHIAAGEARRSLR
jgi:deoxyribonuclease V